MTTRFMVDKLGFFYNEMKNFRFFFISERVTFKKLSHNSLHPSPRFIQNKKPTINCENHKISTNNSKIVNGIRCV